MKTTGDALDALSIALGHDQTASSCPWVGLTRSTADYPSRKATAALAVLGGVLEPTPGLIELLFRCDGCGGCQPDGGALSQILFMARARCVDLNLVTEPAQLLQSWQETGHTYGFSGSAFELLGQGDAGAKTLYVPGATLLARDPSAAAAAFRLVRALSENGITAHPDLLDSAWVLKELGLRGPHEIEAKRVRNLVQEGSYQAIVGGTPKETFALARICAGLPVDVQYAGTLVARSMTTGRLRLGRSDPMRRFTLHLSEYLLHHLDVCDEVVAGVRAWLGEALHPAANVNEQAWPAAVERPLVCMDPELADRLARRRADQLLEQAAGQRLTVLTVDSFSKAALRKTLPDEVEVFDLLTFMDEHRTETDAR